MKLNCKPGDLAVLIRSRKDPSHIGKILTVVAWCALTEGWIVDPPLTSGPISWRSVDDKFLRPIRDGNGEDETFEWAGTPDEVTA